MTVKRKKLPAARRRLCTAFVLAACLGLGGCQRPGQELPDPPIFTMPVPRPAPAAPPALPIAQFRPFTGPTVIYFEGDSTNPDPAARTILDQQAEWLLGQPGVTAVLHGHADVLGSRARQFAIGEMRAAAMRSHLVARGVAPARIIITSLGKQQPLAASRDEESQRRNRRGETIFRGVAEPTGQQGE